MMNGDYTLAAIDIGSNAARLLIKYIEVMPDGETKFRKDLFLRFPLRLGDDVFSIGKISRDKEVKMIRLIKSYKNLMRIYGVQKFKAYATSAMREAKNGKKVIDRVRKETGIKIEIIDGKKEASIIYGNHIEQMSRNRKTCAYVDVGGGSTEVTLIYDGLVFCSSSYNVGTIRMLHNTEGDNQLALNQLKSELSILCGEMGEIDIIGSGGNINKLFKLSNDKKNKDERMSVTALNEIYSELKLLTMEQRMERYALKRDRADVIVPAAEIFRTVADALKSKYIYVPSLGLADGIIDRMFSSLHPQILDTYNIEEILDPDPDCEQDDGITKVVENVSPKIEENEEGEEKDKTALVEYTDDMTKDATKENKSMTSVVNTVNDLNIKKKDK